MQVLDPWQEELKTGEQEAVDIGSATPYRSSHPYIHLEQARVRLVVESLSAIQLFLANTSSFDESNTTDDLSRMSKIVFEYDPVFLMRLFGMFARKFASPRPDSLNLAFASFVWAMCHMDKRATAATLVLLYGKCKKLVISGKSLVRMFKDMYCQSLGGRENEGAIVDQYARGLASQVIAYSRGIADICTIGQSCPAAHCGEVLCSKCVIPASAFVRFVCKSHRAVLWPVAMIQEHLRRCFFGERFWCSLRDVKPLFFMVKSEGRINEAISEAVAVNIFTVTRRLLQLRIVHQEADDTLTP